MVAPGEYLVTLVIGGQTVRRTVTVERVKEIIDDPAAAAAAAAGTEGSEER